MPFLSPNSSRRCILVVDDDPVVRQMLARVLVESGYDAVPAATGDEALRALAALGSVDVALVDVELPGESGWTTLATMRRQVPALRALIITAWPHQQQAARAAGALGCFEKPIDFPELLKAIERALAGRSPETSTEVKAPTAGHSPLASPPPFPST